MYVENFNLSSADWIASAGVAASVAGIIAGWWASHRQVSAHRDLMLEVENRSLERDRQALQGTVTVAAAQYLKLFPAMSGHEPFHCASFLFAYDESSFDHAISALDQVPLKDLLDSCDLVVAINGMKTGMV